MAITVAGSACGKHNAVGYRVVAPAEFAEDIRSDSTAYILDVRTLQEYNEGHIDKAHNLDWLNADAFKAGAQQLPKGSTIYVYCRSGHRSAQAAQYLTSLGYKVEDLDGGYLAWRSAYPAGNR